jgi:hypothetical protein
MRFEGFLLYLASLMMLMSGAALLSSRYAVSKPVLAAVLGSTKFLLPGAILLVSVQRYAVSDSRGAAVLFFCAVGLALAQISRARRPKSRP